MPAGSGVRVSVEDYLFYVDRALAGMRSILLELGDDRAVARPALPGANTPYGLVTHCLGVVEYWAGRLVAGREVVRDREAEFEATGTVARLLDRIGAARHRLAEDLTGLDSAAPPAATPDPAFQGPDRELDRGGVLVHVLEELVQHHGQLEVLRDALLVAPPSVPAFEPPLTWLRRKEGVKWRRPGPDVLPAWVADMDFPVAPAVRAALVETIDRGDLGYPDWTGVHPLAELFAERMASRFDWRADPAHVRGVTDVISALQIVLDLATTPGDGVVLQEPNYPPFRATVPSMGRRVVPLRVVPDGTSWRHDLDALDAALSNGSSARVLLLVNPHNPTGRAFRRDELEAVADLAGRHDLLVVSDEIHADLVHAPGRHVPFASLGADVAARTVTVTSATKAFNIAGVRTAVVHVGSAELRRRWDAEPPDLHGVASSLGVVATAAAWTDGGSWLDGLRDHLVRQRDRLVDGLAGVPGLTLRPPDATYLAWLDWTGADLGEDAAAFFLREAAVYGSPGPDYGASPDWLRLNFATSTALLDQIVERIRGAVGRR
ncbi:aminotransferase class I/II-fold pyridoxal phosphate-dependent enzyme [Jatrophihabitans sp. YIM 134969]